MPVDARSTPSTVGPNLRPGNRKSGLHWREFRLTIALLDAIVVLAAIALTVATWDALAPVFVPTPLFNLWIATTWFLWIFALRVGGGYDLLSSEDPSGYAAPTLRAALVVIVTTLFAYLVMPFAFPRGVALTSPFVVVVALFAWRSTTMGSLLRWSRLERRLLLLGIDDTTKRLASVLTHERRRVPYVALGFIADVQDSHTPSGAVPILGGTDQLWQTVSSMGVAEIAVGQLEGLSKTCKEDLVNCFNQGVGASDARRLYEELTGRVPIHHVGPVWYDDLPTVPRRPYTAVKRAIDFAGGLIGLIVLSPILILVGLLVFTNDGRPVLYRQVRLGRRGERYTIHKFRTMHTDAELLGATYALPNDSRTTSLGRFLRPSGLDELPQLWDVLRGKMSLVGPRPERPEFAERLVTQFPLYQARLLVRPGIVGWAEVHVPHAVTLSDHLTRLEYDFYYLKHSSFVMDLNIVLRSIGLVLGGRRWGRNQQAPPTVS